MKREIQFFKWVDPFNTPVGPRPPRRDDDTAEARDSFTDLENAPLAVKTGVKRKKLGSFIVTSGGIFPVNEWNRPSTEFELWVGHTNFDLTVADNKAAVSVEGVEVFQRKTRYRFLLGVARLFKSADVHASLRTTLCPAEAIVPTAQQVTLEHLRKLLGDASDWAIFSANGKLRTERSTKKNDQDFRKRATEAKPLTTSWENV